MKVYIAGKVTGDPEYRAKFGDAAMGLRRRGHHVINPAMLPGGMTRQDYMSVCLPMVMAAECVVMLPDWKSSGGAQIEHALAKYLGKQIVYA